MKSNILAGFIAGGLLTLPLAAQMPEGYLDVDTIHVKMGKRLEFDSINKRMAEMNRKQGDHWTAYEVVFGDSNAVFFISTRATFAGAWDGMKAFEDATRKAVGEAGMHKLFNDFDATADSEHEVLYRRRWDLSASAPADMAANNKLVGESRWVRVVTIRTRPGKILAFEAEQRRNKEANERMNPGVPFLVSQSIAGTAPGTFRQVNLLKSLGDLDKIKTLQQARGDSYVNLQNTYADAVESIDVMIARYLPELSNPPDEVVAVDPAFWRPKPAAPAKAKPAAKP